MNARKLKCYLTPLATTLLLLSSVAEAKIVCWTNSDGFRECGNSVPPEYAQKKTRTINERGMTTGVKERAKTKDEIAAKDALIAAEKVQIAKMQLLDKEAALREQQQLNHDRVLLSTYLTEKDIEDSRDRQSASFDATIEISRITIDKLNEKLTAEKKKAAGYERQGKPLPERLQQDITSLQEQIDAKNRFIESKESEKQKLHEKYAADMERFRELKKNGVTLASLHINTAQAKKGETGDTHDCEYAKKYYEKDLDNECIQAPNPSIGESSCMSKEKREELLDTRKFIMDEMCKQKK